MDSIIVTGGEGFIGSKIVAQTGAKSYDLKSAQNILNKEQLRSHCANAKNIFHCAAKISVPESISFPEEYYETNVVGTQNIAEIANSNNTKVIFSSSAAVYGECNSAVSEDSPLQPKSPYAQNKIEGEQILSSLSTPAVLLRYFNVYGPGQSAAYAGVISIFIRNALNNKDLVLFGDGKQIRDFIFIDDIVSANIAAMKFESNKTEVFNIASGTETTILDIAQKIITLTGSKSKIIHQDARTGDIVYSQANIQKAKEMLKWSPTTSLDIGLQKTIEYMRSMQ